jgi:hypothetical protein
MRKKLVFQVQSKNSVNHSFTVMPTISMSGKIFGKLCICFQGTSDEFGPFVQKEINELHRKFKNVQITCSKTGKMNNNLINEWSKV